MRRLHKIRDHLALSRNVVLLLAALVLAGTGEKLWLGFGAYYLIRDVTVTSGSFLGAWLWSLGPRVNFTGAAICGALGTLWFWRAFCRGNTCWKNGHFKAIL